MHQADDIQTTTSQISDHLDVPATITNAVRIGKKGTKPRLLMITVNNARKILLYRIK